MKDQEHQELHPSTFILNKAAGSRTPKALNAFPFKLKYNDADIMNIE